MFAVSILDAGIDPLIVYQVARLQFKDSSSASDLSSVVKFVWGIESESIISASIVSIDYARRFRFKELSQGFLREKDALLTGVDVEGATECEGARIQTPGFYIESEDGFSFVC
jgi:hypothetical protein